MYVIRCTTLATVYNVRRDRFYWGKATALAHTERIQRTNVIKSMLPHRCTTHEARELVIKPLKKSLDVRIGRFYDVVNDEYTSKARGTLSVRNKRINIMLSTAQTVIKCINIRPRNMIMCSGTTAFKHPSDVMMSGEWSDLLGNNTELFNDMLLDDDAMLLSGIKQLAYAEIKSLMTERHLLESNASEQADMFNDIEIPEAIYDQIISKYTKAYNLMLASYNNIMIAVMRYVSDEEYLIFMNMYQNSIVLLDAANDLIYNESVKMVMSTAYGTNARCMIHRHMYDIDTLKHKADDVCSDGYGKLLMGLERHLDVRLSYLESVLPKHMSQSDVSVCMVAYTQKCNTLSKIISRATCHKLFRKIITIK